MKSLATKAGINHSLAIVLDREASGEHALRGTAAGGRTRRGRAANRGAGARGGSAHNEARPAGKGAHQRRRDELRGFVDHLRTTGCSAQRGCAIIGLPRSTSYRRPKATATADAAGIEASVGSLGDAYDNALAKSVIKLLKTEVIRHAGTCRSLDDVEHATLEWVAWFNNRRLPAPLGHSPPAEFERQFARLAAARMLLEHSST